MASMTTRTPMERFFAASDKTDQKAILSSGVNYVKNFCDTKGLHFAYNVSEKGREALTKSGISLHPVPYLAHSHPFSKMMENNILINVLPGLLGNGRWVFSSIKGSKVESIVKKTGGVKNNLAVVNKCVCAKDFSRYDFEPNSVDIKINVMSQEHLFPESYLNRFHNQKIFIHDEVHHWDLSSMIHFLDKAEPKLLLCSVVYPPELLAGIREPQNKELYDFKVGDKSFFFFPDGCRDEGYEQKESARWIFECAGIEVGDRYYTVKMIYSKYAHHLFQISVGRKITESKRFFGCFDTIDLQVIHEQKFRMYDYIPIKKRHIEKIYTYLLCLKKPDVESAIAKLRQILEDEIDCRVVEFFCKFSKDIISKFKGKIDLYEVGWIEEAKDLFLGKLPLPVRRLFNRWGGLNIFHFLFSLNTLQIVIDTRVMSKADTFFDFTYEPIKCDLLASSLPEFIDNKFFYDAQVKRSDWVTRIKNPDPLHVNGAVHRVPLIQMVWEIEKKRRIEANLRPRTKNEQLRLKWRENFTFPDQLFRNLDPICSRCTPVDHWPFLKSKQNRDRAYIKKFVDPIWEMILHELECETVNIDDMPIETTSDLEIVEVCEIADVPVSDNISITHAVSETPKTTEPPSNQVVERAPAFIPPDQIECHSTIAPTQISEVIDVKGDGNCFFRALRMSIYGDDSEYMKTRLSVLKQADKLGIILNEEQRRQIGEDGCFSEEWVVKFVVNVLGLTLHVVNSESCVEKEILKGFSLVYEQGESVHAKIVCTGNHFKAFKERDIEFIEKFRLMDGKDKFTELNDFIESQAFLEAEATDLKGRTCFFFSDMAAIDYGHNGIKYKRNQLNKIDDLIPKSIKRNTKFNAMLIQIFQEGASIGFHRDNEKVYDDDEILSINLRGQCSFLVENGERYEFKLSEGEYVLMMKGFQEKFRHSVANCSAGRVNVTFRRHVRNMKGKKLPNEIDFRSVKEGCLVRAIAKAESRCEQEVLNALVHADEEYWGKWAQNGIGSSVDDLIKAATDLKFNFFLLKENMSQKFNIGDFINYAFEVCEDHIKFVSDMPSCIMDSGIPLVELNANGKRLLNDVDREHWNTTQYLARGDAAMLLKQSFLDRTTGKFLSDVFGDMGKAIKAVEVDPFDIMPTDVDFIAGFAGSGKSFSILESLGKVTKGKFMIISPRRNLCDSWSESKPKIGKRAVTFEVALSKSLKMLELIVIDELGLFPRGYLDLLIYMLERAGNKSCRILCLFDPIQARYHSDNDEGRLFEEHDLDRMIAGSHIKYIYESRRLHEGFYKTLFPGLKMFKPTTETEEMLMFENHLVAINECEKRGRALDCILVASRCEVGALSCCKRVMTFGESQGLTFDRVGVVFSEFSEKQCDKGWMVALTRARKSVTVIMMYRGGASAFMQNNSERIPSLFLSRRGVSSKRIEMMMGCKVEFLQRATFGSDEVDREERLEGDPFLKPFIFLGQRVNCEEVEIISPEIIEPICKSHLFLPQENFANAKNFDLIRAKELREFRIGQMETNQFTDNFERVGPLSVKDVAGPLRFESIFPRHKSDDDLTFWMAVKKRLRFSEPFIERAKLKDAGGVGSLLYLNLKEKLQLNFRHDPALLDECINDFEKKKLQKSKATIAAHCLRSDSDWSLDSVFIFMKNQLCTKKEKQYVDAKAGQTLACFSHMILVKFAPYCRYMEKMLNRALGDEIYIHSNKNFDALNEWVKKHFEEGSKIESDYEAFDASQDQFILSFEIELMHDMGLPDSFINDYVDLKCTLGCKLGQFAIMRFTGEFCTFLFNTLANMAFTYARYDCAKGHPIAFAGDDMCMLRSTEVTDKFNDIFEKISLKAKVISSERPTFCGWNLSKHGIVKCPELIYNRFMVAKERGNVDECLENYAIEASYAYSLGEKLFEVLKSEEEIEYHQLVVRYIVKRISKLKTGVKALFSDQCLN